jgi:hypothetical protein
MNCRICTADTRVFGRATVRGKHAVAYYQCGTCGFVQTDEPAWLAEAYAEAINRSDVGIVRRNLTLAVQSSVIIAAFFDPHQKFIDFGGGYGLLVRLMRDRGYDFYHFDAHCANLFARGLDADAVGSGQYELLTAFEVFEHLPDPAAAVGSMLSYSSSILFSTELVSVPAPQPDAWWYYGLDHGQHISFFTPESLRILAGRFGLNLYTNNRSLHLLTRKKISAGTFALFSRYKVARLIDLVLPERSLLPADYRKFAGRDLT